MSKPFKVGDKVIMNEEGVNYCRSNGNLCYLLERWQGIVCEVRATSLQGLGGYGAYHPDPAEGWWDNVNLYFDLYIELEYEYR